MRILTVNPGSSSLKLSMIDPDGTVVTENAGARHEVAPMVADMPAPDAVGVRFVHGGTDFTGPVVVDARASHFGEPPPPLEFRAHRRGVR